VLVNDVAAATANASGNAVTVTVPPATKPGPAQMVVLDAVGRSRASDAHRRLTCHHIRLGC